jgi:anti-sigma regulatory factor (Ser/Thr protein kinase)
MSTLQVPATLDSLAPLAAAVLTAARAAGLGRQAAYRLRLAVDELAANVITYGYAGVAPRADRPPHQDGRENAHGDP